MKKYLSIIITAACFISTGVSASGRIKVYPLFFVPNDSSISEDRLNMAHERLMKHLESARKLYRSFLVTDTFQVEGRKLNVYRSGRNNFYYTKKKRGEHEEDSAHKILKELFDWQKEDRITSRRIYLVIYVRPENDLKLEKTTFLGGGRTFNGQPGSGGGYLEMEYSSLMGDYIYPFQSTLVHELGHAFGLIHVDVYKYDMKNNDSIMSYNPSHHSKGLISSPAPKKLNPEEYLGLSFNKEVFPGFKYTHMKHNPSGKKLKLIYLGGMREHVGAIRHQAGEGYELFYNGSRVNGPEAAFYTYRQAEENCLWNMTNRKNIKVECRYNGSVFQPAE